MKCDFSTVSERDMDMLFLNAFSIDPGFLDLFIKEVSLPDLDYKVREIYLSKTDNDGESDITVIVESLDKRIGLLIEDKIDVLDMPAQPERYIKKGNKGSLD